ncbi:septal ring lytic transglycosylase RlpA family protein [uncultured Thiodictyon sp.]|uniref:septal ring lytic transglycosylase RlpA family protein n=1 Tax=uncultured Thiodictyon sp. TaxID=1846217 RepID=UPI0025D687CE|nr:septal ring lytic transglycosylase RlpA family protein [uncultured Thiodictyon sp.]
MNAQTEPRQTPPDRLAPAAAALLLSAALLLLGGCSGQGTRDADGAYRQLDPNAIPDAVPRVEPRSKYGNMASYRVRGRVYHTQQDGRGHVERGLASWYGKQFHGQRTSSGERYDMYGMTAAHKTLPLPSYARVTNLENGRSAVVRINDRGPFHSTRVIDLSYAAATKIGVFPKGTATVEIRGIDPAAPNAAPGLAPSADPGPFLADSGGPGDPLGGKAHDAAIAQSLAIASRASGPPRRRAAAAAPPLRERAATSAFAALDAEPTPEPTPAPVARPAPRAVEKTPPTRVAARSPATPPVAAPVTAPAAVAARVPPAAATGQGIYLQIGAFGDQRNAERLRDRLSPHLAARVRVQRPAADGSLYKVRVGPLDSEGEARRLSAKLSSLGVSESPRLVWN